MYTSAAQVLAKFRGIYINVWFFAGFHHRRAELPMATEPAKTTPSPFVVEQKKSVRDGIPTMRIILNNLSMRQCIALCIMSDVDSKRASLSISHLSYISFTDYNGEGGGGGTRGKRHRARSIGQLLANKEKNMTCLPDWLYANLTRRRERELYDGAPHTQPRNISAPPPLAPRAHASITLSAMPGHTL